jgi:hypothetical protein
MYIATCFSCIGGFVLGIDTGIVSGALLYLKVVFQLSEVEQELFVSIALVGS